ncbi:D-aspartate oxidase-like isoform X2 [Watersipora subatra]|uniref:D-aspartate oxidase-like isoform X2 n=1 Tax=Watersipora subatra TaxID=2589382 RepID=UPI00355ADDA2
MTANPTRIGVIGAGIIGMSSAYRLQTELVNTKVTVVADAFTPNLTSDGSGGLWELYDFFNTKPERIRKWGKDTYAYLKKLCLSPESRIAGTSFLRVITLSRQAIELPSFANEVEHCRKLLKEELETRFPQCSDGFSFTSMTCEPKIYLPWLSQKFMVAGGEMRQEKVSDLSVFCDQYDLVINCAGLMASTLANDSSLYPIRGQVIKVKGVDCLNGILLKPFYILPGLEIATLGGTHEKDNDDTTVDENAKEMIMKGCCELEPSFKNAVVEMDWVGLRPARRNGVRLELDTSFHPTTKVIHNYGHAGIGVTTHWGCAEEVLSLARQCLEVASKAAS